MSSLILLSAVYGALQIPALADEVWFTKYDTSHAGYWTWPEFQAANMDWAARHNMTITEPELHEQWVTISKKHNGKVYVEDVRTVRQWD
jgi:hypothetical protein